MPSPTKENPNLGKHLYSALTFIDSEKTIHSRQVYNVLDFIGDLGGVLELMISIVGILVMPATEQLFTIKMASEVYMANTKDPEGY